MNDQENDGLAARSTGSRRLRPATEEPDDLRPLERRVLRLRAEGQDDAEIGQRFRRSPEHIRRVAELARIARHPSAEPADRGDAEELRPLERRVLAWRDEGATPNDLAPKFKHSPEHMARVEDLARYKLRRADDSD